MNSNNNKNNESMPDDNWQLPPELNWEQMEAGILQKMDDLESTAKSQQKKSWKKRVSFWTGFVMLLILTPLVCTQVNEDISLIEDLQLTQKQTFLENLQTNQNDEKKSITKSNTNSTANKVNRLVETDIKTENSLTTSPKKSDSRVSESMMRNQPIAKRTELSKTIFKQKIDLIHTDDKTNVAVKEVKISTPNEIEKNKGTVNIPFVSALKLRELEVKSIEYKDISTIFSSPILKKERLDEPHSKQAARLTLTAGISAWNMGYGGSTKPIRHEYEKSLISYNAQLNYIHPLKSDFIILTGLQFQQLENRINWSEALENHMISISDALIEIERNAITGEETEFRGEALLTVEAERRIQHYNKTRLLQMPLALGKTWTSKKWQADLLIGGTVNLFTSNKGRTVYQDVLQYYDGASTDFLQNQWKFNAMLNSSLTYKINDNLGLSAGIQIQKGLSNWSKELNVKMRPNVINVAIGLSYSL